MNISSWLLTKAIHKAKQGRKALKQFCTLDTARKVGLVAVLEPDGKLDADIVRTMQHLQGGGAQVTVLAYYDGRQLPQGFGPRAQMKVYTRKEINWYGRPQSVQVDEFLKEEYEIVIDCVRKPDVPALRYVLQTVDTQLLVGGVHYPGCPYDLIIDTHQAGSIHEYVEQITRYLLMISKSNIQTSNKNG